MKRLVDVPVLNEVRQPVVEREQVQLHSAEQENAPPREWSARSEQ
ncbi:hypothetical protein ACFS7Z_07125 [Pontibacter toksunensis]|uniref:Uncharacterized protein n=1 Tax=Pontibacter toksunensis TaxID=1332631 RepID=A0ABW6BSP2_9BACT